MKLRIGEYYQHRYGGVYVILGVSTSTVDKSSWVVYEHIYPFENALWHRPYEEFIDGRFHHISNIEYIDIINHTNRQEFQNKIEEEKSRFKR